MSHQTIRYARAHIRMARGWKVWTLAKRRHGVIRTGVWTR